MKINKKKYNKLHIILIIKTLINLRFNIIFKPQCLHMII